MTRKKANEDKIRTALALSLWRTEFDESDLIALPNREDEFKSALPRLSPNVSKIINTLEESGVTLTWSE